jgi:hypothetical protein
MVFSFRCFGLSLISHFWPFTVSFGKICPALQKSLEIVKAERTAFIFGYGVASRGLASAALPQLRFQTRIDTNGREFYQNNRSPYSSLFVSISGWAFVKLAGFLSAVCQNRRILAAKKSKIQFGWTSPFVFLISLSQLLMDEMWQRDGAEEPRADKSARAINPHLGLAVNTPL